jgi:hypothetical protein
MLRCTKCEQEKQASAFYKNRRSPTGYRPDCKACVAQHQQGHYKDNCEDILARNREYRLAHLTEEAVRSAKWRANHQPQILATRKVYYAKNRASILARNSVHVHRHRHARQRTQTIDSFSLDDIATRDAWVCQICFRKVNKRLKYPHPLSGSLDHVIPLSRGGYHTRQNVVLTHLRCNLVKNAHAVPQQQRLF